MTRPGLTYRDLAGVGRPSAPALSTDGRLAAFVASAHDPDRNEVRHTIRCVDLDTRELRELTPGPGNHTAPAFSPDGRLLAFASDRDPDRGEQLWVLPLGGGEARRVTSGWGGVKAPAWAPDSRRLAFARRVPVPVPGADLPDPDPRAGPDLARAFGLANPKSTARVYDGLLYRHWDRWADRTRSHLFAADAETGELGDLTPGDRDAPPIALGSDRDWDWSPDGRALAFTANPDPVVARSTNNSVFLLPVDGLRPAGEPRCVSVTRACDSHPRFLPDGRLAYLGMGVPGPQSA
ncbi:MAG: TolB family protein, partial [Deferrisomatales bacterium]